MRVFLGLVCAVGMLVGCVQHVVGGEDPAEYQIIFSTFESDSAGKYSYLRDSIQGMLISRLAAKDRIQVVDEMLGKSELSQLKKKKDFSSLSEKYKDVDYIITGRLFSVTSGLQIHVNLYPLDTSREILNFSVLSKVPENIITDIGKLTEQISQEGFGYSVKALSAGKSDERGTGAKGFVTAHPEAAYKKGLYTGTVVGSKVAGFDIEAVGMKRKLNIDGEIIALEVGDADGDGKQELFVLEGTRLGVYRVEGRQILKIEEAKLPSDMRVHALNLADINGDGLDEIYLSATEGLSVSSMILAWHNGKGFSYFAKGIPLYLRPLYIPTKGICLAGQKRGFEKIDLVKPGIQLYTLDSGNKLQAGEKLPIPEGVNLFDFIYGDLDGDRFYELVVIDQDENLKVYSPSNELMWISGRKFGGSKTYLGPSQGEAANEQDRNNFSVEEDANRDLIFVPGRITVVDINGDGREEVVVNESKMSTLGFFKRLRPYKSGMVVGLVWQEHALVEAWRTGIYRGYITDYSFVISDSDAKTRSTTQAMLYVANIPSSGTLVAMLPGSRDTDLSVYELGFSVNKSK